MDLVRGIFIGRTKDKDAGKEFRKQIIAQVHSAKEFAAFHFDAHVVHFVDKSFDVPQILARYKGDIAEEQAAVY